MKPGGGALVYGTDILFEVPKGPICVFGGRLTAKIASTVPKAVRKFTACHLPPGFVKPESSQRPARKPISWAN